MEKTVDKLKILVVDDDRISTLIFDKVLKDKYNVIIANSGKEALKILNDNKDISLVILDIYMPEINGFQVLETIKNKKSLKNIPVLMCTASTNDKNVEKALELGATDCLVKPVHTGILRKRVSNVIKREYLERLSLEHLLANTTSKLHLLMDTIPGGIMELKASEGFKVVYYNNTICQMLDLSKKVFEEKYNNNIFNLIYDSDRNRVEKVFYDSLESDSKIDIIFRLYQEDDFPIWVHLIASKYEYNELNDVYHAVVFDISNEKKAELDAENEAQKFRYLAEHDSLTGINNRKAFCEKTEDMLFKNIDKEYVLLCFDIEKFKVVNDVFGNEVGNRILKVLAMHFASTMLGIGTYGRLSDDHFAICFPKDHCSVEDAYKGAKSAVNQININYDIAICMGIYYIEDLNIPVSNMCDRACLALEETKGNYLKNYAYYDQNLIERLVKEQEMCSEMQDALKNEEFQVYVQPKFDLLTNRIVGGESLIRWIHPTKNLISPAEFIPLFEKNGAIVHIDSFVWDKTCQYIRDWQNEGIDIVPFSVNISRVDFVNIDILKHIEELVEKYQIDRQLLELEVTESVYADDCSIFYTELEKFQKAGYKILMDDFGSGYSSFNMLKEAPVDGLKLDLKFLSGTDNKHRADKILTAIMYMTKLINMTVVAEGVETQKHVDLLKEIHCDVVQGYHYSRPVPAQEFKQMLLDQKAKDEFTEREYEEIAYQSYLQKRKRYKDNTGLVLIGEDSKISQDVLCSLLEDKCNIISASDGEAAWNLIQNNANDLDVVLLDINMPKLTGIEILKLMKKDHELCDIPVIIMSSNDNIDMQINTFELGAVDYLTKPFIPKTVQARVLIALNASLKLKQIKKERETYQHRAILDQMTGLYNKVTLEEMINRILLNSNNKLHAFFVFDVDNFKAVNDSDGHLQGDHLIKLISKMIVEQFRKHDIVGRIGGDEFIAFMKDVSCKDEARNKAKQLVKIFTDFSDENISVDITLSIGLSFAFEDGTTYRELFSTADRALYRAKSKGKCQYIEYKKDLT